MAKRRSDHFRKGRPAGMKSKRWKFSKPAAMVVEEGEGITAMNTAYLRRALIADSDESEKEKDLDADVEALRKKLAGGKPIPKRGQKKPKAEKKEKVDLIKQTR